MYVSMIYPVDHQMNGSQRRQATSLSFEELPEPIQRNTGGLIF